MRFALILLLAIAGLCFTSCAAFQNNPSTVVKFHMEKPPADGASKGETIDVFVDKGAFESDNDVAIQWPTGKDTPPISVNWKAKNDPSKAIAASAESLGKIADFGKAALDKVGAAVPLITGIPNPTGSAAPPASRPPQ